MPGILPMKVIKVGTSSQSRIAQACDRCRSKKIRCDGIRPTCSQCANVGFECKTSDKLSRRAFPRGYTESLEERVRQLEAEIRDLKDLLDEKDEKIDMLSKMHGNHRSPSMASATTAPSPDSKKEAPAASPPPKEDTFRVQASPLLLGVENSDSYFMGASSGRAFIEAFKRKMQENGKACSDFNSEAFLHIQGCYPLVSKQSSQNIRSPPRLFSDRSVNVYFQEWAPLFPVLHKPTFLRIYEEFVADPEKVKSNHKLAQLYLVFGIASLSSEHPDFEQIAFCETRWQKALETILMDNTMISLQCLVLALMYCTIRADYKRLQHYKAIAVGLSHRLGLHQSQKRFSFGALTIETRKKVFWTLYTLDCFSAATLGLPKLLKESDIHTEYPSDTDDEYVTEKGFQPTLPGEYTRLSGALALFRATRVLAKVLEKNYPAATSHELSLQQMSALDAELQEWSENLPPHLKLTFKQDKPSTDVTGNRSPLLAVAYYYIRGLIYRPAVGSSLGFKAAPALMTVGESSKHLIQIVQLLEERNMSFSFCLNKADVLFLCGFTILYQCLDLKQESKLLKDGERLTNEVIKAVMQARAPGSYDFWRVASLLVKVDELPQGVPTPRNSPDVSSAVTIKQRASPPAPGHRKSTPSVTGRPASVGEAEHLAHQEKLRRMTMSSTQDALAELHLVRSRQSLENFQRGASAGRLNHRYSVSHMPMAGKAGSSHGRPGQNLDYLSLGNTPVASQPTSPDHERGTPQQMAAQLHQQGHQLFASPHLGQKMAGNTAADWEALLGALDGGQLNVYDAIYGGQGLGLGSDPSANSGPASSISGSRWSPDPWDLGPGFGIGNMESATSAPSAATALSISEEGLSPGEEVSSSGGGGGGGSSGHGHHGGQPPSSGPGRSSVSNDLGIGNMTLSALEFRHPMMSAPHPPQVNVPDLFGLDGLDSNFGL